jgi:hypothetical protein
LVVAFLLSAARYCCRSSHAVMRSPTLSSPAAFTAFAAPVVGWYLYCRPQPALVIARPANVRYSIPSSPRCPQTLSSPAAACLCHSRRWLVVVSSFATHFHCPTPSLPRCPQTLSLPAVAHLCHSR